MQLELGQGLLPETAHEAQRTAACQAPRCWYKQKPGGHGQSQGQGVGAKSAKESGTSPRVGGAGVHGRHAGSGGRQSGPGWARGVVDASAPWHIPAQVLSAARRQRQCNGLPEKPAPFLRAHEESNSDPHSLMPSKGS